MEGSASYDLFGMDLWSEVKNEDGKTLRALFEVTTIYTIEQRHLKVFMCARAESVGASTYFSYAFVCAKIKCVYVCTCACE